MKLTCLGATVLAITICLLAASLRAAPPPDWAVELSPAFDSYYAGDMQQAQRRVSQVLADFREPAVQRQARAFEAMLLMHSELRSERQAGRSQFAQIIADEPTMADSPEFLLAVGVAHRGLDESSAAIAAMHSALDGFISQKRFDRALVAAVQLARCWAAYTEWELGVPSVIAPRIEDPAQRDATRLEQIASTRARVASLPSATGALSEIDLIAIEIELGISERAAAAEQRLVALAAGSIADPASADAAMLLATRRMAESRWTDATDLLERARQSPDATRAARATKLLSEIVTPTIEMSIAGTIAPGDDAIATLRARNVRSISVEVRGINLASWLTRENGRLREAALPGEGSVIESRQLASATQQPHDWFAAPADALRFKLPRGAYVLVARTGKDDSGSVVAQRLFIVGDLDLRVVTGESRMLLAATRGGAILPGDTPARVRFWVEGYETPQVIDLKSGGAVAEMPNLFRILKTPHWTALVEVGDDVAFCQGSVSPGAIEQSPLPSVLSVGAPPAGPETSEWTVAGIVMWPGAITPPSTLLSLTYELVDLSDRVIATHTGSADVHGAFRVRFNIPAGSAGQTLRLQVRAGGRVLPAQGRTAQFRVHRTDMPQMVARLDLPPHIPTLRPVLPVDVPCETPWGAPITSCSARLRALCVQLPSPTEPHPKTGAPIAQSVPMNSLGQLQAHFAIQHFGKNLAPPLAIHVVGRAFGWDGRDADVESSTLVDARRVALWTTIDPPHPIVGESVRFSMNWFDPTDELRGARPTLTVRHNGEIVAELQSGPVLAEMWSDAWMFPAPGEYELETRVATDSGPIIDKRTVKVEEARERQGAVVHAVNATFDAAAGQIAVTLTGQSVRPLVAVALRGEPIAAAMIAPFAGSATCTLPLPARAARGDYEVLLADAASPTLAPIARTRVRDAEPTEFSIKIAPVPSGSRSFAVTVNARGLGDPTGTLWLRLTPRRDIGTVEWTLAQLATTTATDDLRLGLASSRAREIAPAARWTPLGPIVPGALATLSRGESIALDQFDWRSPGDGAETTLSLPLPETPGDYRLCAVLRTGDGRWHAAEAPLSVDRPLRIEPYAPRSLMVGDRVAVPIRIWNDTDQAVEGRLNLEAGGNLVVDSLTLDNADRTPIRVDVPTMSIGARSAITLLARCEAIRAGRGSLEAEFTTGADTARGQASYRVFDAPAPPTDPVVSIERSYYRVVATLEKEEASGGREKPIRFDRREQIPLAPGEIVPAGALILVEETLTVRRSLRDLEWTQRAPSNCITFGSAESNLKLLAPHQDVRLDSVRGRRESLEAGQYAHQYVWTAQRHGSARLPLPELRASRQAVSVELKPADSVLIVER